MENKLNCWELKQCGREQGGPKAGELGVCPAALDSPANGINSGSKGGRICWAVAGTLCGGKKQGTFAEKRLSCISCEVYERIETEEGVGFQLKV